MWTFPHQASCPDVVPWKRWVAFGWLFLGIPAWLWANNLVYWSLEQKMVALGTTVTGAVILAVGLATYAVVGRSRVIRGVGFQRAWTPAELRAGFVVLVWIGVATAIAKTTMHLAWGMTQTVFVGLAAMLTVIVWMDRWCGS